jgi:1-propanol dehydrogenase
MVYFSGRPIPLAAIPTTSGSGSEVTDFAVLTHNGVKHPLVDEGICPRVAILDGDLLHQLPRSLIADTGFDVLSHTLEAFVATGATPFSDAMAGDAFATAVSLLPESFSGNISARQPLHEAATMAGLAFNQAGLGLCHAMAHALGGAFHIPHGRLGGILLPAVLEANSQVCREKYARLARQAGLGGTSDTIALRNLKNALIRLRKQLNMPATLQDAGIAPRQVSGAADALIRDILADPCCKTNPLPVTRALAGAVLREVTGRG